MVQLIIVYAMVPSFEEASRIADDLVQTHLAACVNIISGIQSTYIWKGKTCNDHELMLMVKAPASNFEAIRSRIRSLHSYECPEILSIEVRDCDADYYKWVCESACKKKNTEYRSQEPE
jgi:periplasmic divalent cation tolerance protein